MYDHSGITISTGSFSDRWDSGCIGIAYMTKKQILDCTGGKIVTQERLLKARAIIDDDVETYDDYLTGDVYGYSIEDPEGNDVHSCSGYFGSDMIKNGILDEVLSNINWDIKSRKEKRSLKYLAHFKYLKNQIKNKLPLIYRKACNI